MRRLLFLLLAPALPAQVAHYENGVLVEQRQVSSGRKFDFQGLPTLAYTSPGGARRVLTLPPELDGRTGDGVLLAQRQGTLYALARFHATLPVHPALEALAQEVRQGQPLHLLASREGRAWEDLALLPREHVAGLGAFLPLGDGRFLLGNTSHPFTLGGQASPFAFFGVDGGRRLRLEGLLCPDGEGGAAARRHAWQLQVLPAGILMVHGFDGRWLLLDDRDGRRVSQGRLWKTGEAELACLAARPDGQALVVVFPGSRKEALQAWPAGDFHARLPGGAYPSDPAADLILRRCEALDDLGLLARPTLRWMGLDVRTGAASRFDPPRDFPPPLNRMEAGAFKVIVQPDGSLRLRESFALRAFLQIPSRRWVHRLLHPFGPFAWEKP